MTTYKTVTITDALKVKKLAAAVEEKANEMACGGWELAAFSTTPSGKAILVFRAPCQAAAETVEGYAEESETAEAVDEAE